jgi:predicted 3-demethylubiquinone-9 3-methyltransferase (glyoxalase superfamily)
MQKITPCLWFDDNAEEAVNYYTSVFTDSKIGKISRYGDTGPGVPGSVLTCTFSLNGKEFMALNGGPMFKFTEAVSFVVDCETQQEIDMYWEKLSVGGEIQQCGWLKDKFGLSRQIVPAILGELMTDKDAVKSGRVMSAVLKMEKIDINVLKEAAKG